MPYNTYRLDQRGIPYKVLQTKREQGKKGKKEPQQEAGLLRHSGKLESFRLYMF